MMIIITQFLVIGIISVLLSIWYDIFTNTPHMPLTRVFDNIRKKVHNKNIIILKYLLFQIVDSYCVSFWISNILCLIWFNDIKLSFKQICLGLSVTYGFCAFIISILDRYVFKAPEQNPSNSKTNSEQSKRKKIIGYVRYDNKKKSSQPKKIQKRKKEE